MLMGPVVEYKQEKVVIKIDYNKSEIMKNAHTIYEKGGFTWAQALSESWRLYKLDEFKDRLFLLTMKDRFDSTDWAYHRAINDEIRKLQNIRND